MTEQETQETNEQNEAETTHETIQEAKAKTPKLNTPTKATELILKHLNKAQKQNLIDELTDTDKEMVAHVVVELYTDYEINNVVPTLDGFAAICPSYGITDQALIEAVLDMKKDPFIKSSKAPVAIAVVLIAALAAAGAYVYANNQTTETKAETEVEEIIEEVAGVLDFDITAENWTEDSSPFIAHVTGETDKGDEIDFYHAVWADGSTDTVELDAGEYTVTWTSAINADGSIYVTTDVVTEVTVESDGTVTGEETFDQIAAEDVTSEQLEEILAQVLKPSLTAMRRSPATLGSPSLRSQAKTLQTTLTLMRKPSRKPLKLRASP